VLRGLKGTEDLELLFRWQCRRSRGGCPRRRTSQKTTKASGACRSRPRLRWLVTSSPFVGTGSSRICCRQRVAQPSTASASTPWDRWCIPVSITLCNLSLKPLLTRAIAHTQAYVAVICESAE
jgi:hypothetical protein